MKSYYNSIIFYFFLLISLISLCLANGNNNDERTYSTDSIRNFIQWFNENGGKANKITIQESIDPSLGLGIYTLDNVNESDEVLYVPNNLVFSIESLQSSNDPIHQKIFKKYASNNENDILVSILLLEKYRGIESFYFPYIELLPRNIPNLMSFSSEELQALEDKKLMKIAIEYKNRYKDVYETCYAIALECWNSKYLDMLTYHDFIWANAIIDSRGFRIRGKVYLVPFADMFNYKSHENFRMRESGEFFLKYHLLDSQGIRIHADRNAVKSQELFEDYGDNSDSIYMLHHGFIPDVNPFKCLEISGFNNVTLTKSQLQLMTVLKFKQIPQQCLDEVSFYNLGKVLKIYLISMSFNNKELEYCESLISNMKTNGLSWNQVFDKCKYNQVMEFLDVYAKSRMFLTHSTLPYKLPLDASDSSFNDLEEDSLELRTLAFLQAALEFQYPNYNTTLSQDQEDLLNQSNVKLQIALKYRINQKNLWFNVCVIYGAHCNISNKESSSSSDLSLELQVSRFNEWFQSNLVNSIGFQENKRNKIKAQVSETYRISAVVVDDILGNETYLHVPLSVIIDHEMIRQPSYPLYDLIQTIEKKYKRTDEFHELLFVLLYERFVRIETSFYWPYLSLLPSIEDLAMPTAWNNSYDPISKSFSLGNNTVSQRLYPSFLVSYILAYRTKIQRLYQSISSMEEIIAYDQKFLNIFTYENYLWGNLILDSRSIWWYGKRHLVPMLDFVNCQENPNVIHETHVHSTNLDDSLQYAITKSDGKYSIGDELFENYGQPNYVYYQYHGFILPNNSHDCVLFEMRMSEKEILAIDFSSPIVMRIAKVICIYFYLYIPSNSYYL